MRRISSVSTKIRTPNGTFEPIPALRGLSSYEQAVKNGFKGTEDEWLTLMLGDGWVGAYQDLEANKANKVDVYTKEEIITDETKNLFGLQSDITPNDAFTKLAMANMKNLVIMKITSSTMINAPDAVGGLFKFFIVGGGGSGGRGYYADEGASDPCFGGGGGGSGELRIATQIIPKGTEIYIECGAGGIYDTDRYSTMDGGETRVDMSIEDENGAFMYYGYVASGGRSGTGATSNAAGSGGDGLAGGGGGGIVARGTHDIEATGNGGNGLEYGGGGGSGLGFDDIIGIGGTGIGRGGSVGYQPKYGTLFNDNLLNVLFDHSKIGLKYDAGMPINAESSVDSYPGDGGIGCRGGNASNGCGGGGGYCGNGGDGSGCAGGGGGGYCGNGGKGIEGGGGGGGFFCDGGDGSPNSNFPSGGGGGGFFCDGGDASTDIPGNGGDGGVLIMYIKKDEGGLNDAV